MDEIAKERDEAFTAFVKSGDLSKAKAYCKKYGVPIPEDEKVMAAGIYKAVQYCTEISEDVKDMAFKKCLELGFSPYLMPYEGRKRKDG